MTSPSCTLAEVISTGDSTAPLSAVAFTVLPPSGPGSWLSAAAEI
jgi:hypothetical protein